MEINCSSKKLAEYVLDQDHEREDYINYCNSNKTNPLLMAENDSHIYAHAINVIYDGKIDKWVKENFSDFPLENFVEYCEQNANLTEDEGAILVTEVHDALDPILEGEAEYDELEALCNEKNINKIIEFFKKYSNRIK